ncbi:type II secretion system F family protein [Nocardia mexicana]|uniref:Type II secretion system protein F (GspF) n=1 Tax=Nocardia mexicana TaxID=279262 RepID=A0A370GTQ6_9NOCA|nr:type II secretion system F family protein [Nocardia mexicana]RDI47078.1 type II secretion system protein F (GspF) [Nocardia mexicana]
MSAAIACLALALALLPAPAGRRRFARLLGGARRTRKVPLRIVIRVGVGLAVAGAAVLGIGPLLAVAAVVGTAVVRMRCVRRDRGRAAECVALEEGLDTVVGELRVGAHPSAAAATAAGEISGAAARAFAVCSARSRLGGSAAAGLRDPDAVIATELARIADAWEVAEQHGLALADLLAAARADLVSRRRFRDRTVAALSGARATAAVLAGLPLLGIALGHLLGAAPLRVLLAPGLGTVLLPLGTALISAGLLWTDTITRRVLT